MNNVESFVPTLEILIADAKILKNDSSLVLSPNYKKWRLKSLGVLRLIYGDDSPESKAFATLRFSPSFFPADYSVKAERFRGDLDTAIALLESCSELLLEFGLPSGQPLLRKDSSGQLQVVINNNNSQSQLQIQEFIFNFENELTEKIEKSTNKDEKSFLEKVKIGLKTVKSTAELVKLILDTAKQFGFDINQVSTIFS